MMNQILKFAALFLLFSNLTYANVEISKKNLRKHVDLLSANALSGRLTGTLGERLAAQYVADQFNHLGLSPAGDNGTFFQHFKFSTNFKPKNVIELEGKFNNTNQFVDGRNVLGRLKCSNIAPIIVVGAHVDHLGRGNISGSLANKNQLNMIHPGADDNASGIAILIETAIKLKQLQTTGKLRCNNDILFAAWSGEELGILGASHFVKNLMHIQKEKDLSTSIKAVINLDMVGHLRENKLVIQGTGSSLAWVNILQQANRQHHLSLITQRDPYLPTDSTAFYLR